MLRKFLQTADEVNLLVNVDESTDTSLPTTNVVESELQNWFRNLTPFHKTGLS